MIKLFLLALLLTTALSQQVLQFEIYKSYANDPHDLEKVNIGTLEIQRNTEYNQLISSIQPKYPVLVSETDLERSTVILTFVPKKIKDVQHDNKVYKTAVIERLPGPHDQIIGVVFGTDLKIKAINYFEKRSQLQQIRAEVIKMQAGKQQIAKMQMAVKKGGGPEGSPQEESFFAKYKWAIIIGIALVWLLTNADSGKPAQPGAPQQ